jgi:hypothetical protein
MAVEFDTVNSLNSQGYLSSSGYCVCPSSNTEDWLLLTIEYFQNNGLSTTLNAPTVGAVSGTLISSSSGVSIYSFPGGTVGNASFTFSTNPASFRAWCVRLSGQKSTTPFSAGYAATTSGLSHNLVAGINAPYPGAAFVAAIVATAYPLGEPGVLVGFDSQDSIFDADETADPLPGGGYAVIMPLNVAVRFAEDAGDTGLHTWSSSSENLFTPVSASAAIAGFWVSPSQAPSAMAFTSPTTGQLYAVGRDVPVTWNASSDPNVASSLLTYELEYTINGFTWVPLDTTSAGATSYLWDTSGEDPSSTVQLRGRANNGTEYGPWAYSSIFTLLADSPPGAPQNVAPTGIVNQSEDLEITFTFNDPGDLQKTLEVQWSANADMSSPSTTGTITTSNAFYTFDASTDILATVGTRYYRVRNQGIVDSTNGTWSAIKTIQVTAPISAPNITFPTAASPPTSGTVLATFTGSGHTKIKYRIVSGGVELYVSADLITGGNSFTLGISLANDTTYTLFLKRAASDGLWSTEDSETFLVSYVGPAIPGLTATPIDEAGYIQFLIQNTDTPTGQYIFIDGVQLDTPLLPPDALFNYAGATSGEEISVVVRAFVSTGGYTDSVPVLATQNLQGLFLFEPTQELTTANFVSAPIRVLEDSNEPEINTGLAMVKLRKRTKQVAHFRRGFWRVLNYSVMVPSPQISVANQLEAWLENRSTVCARDNFSHKVNGNITSLDVADYMNSIRTPLVITENSYQEEV